jgi:hypothetical protein
VTLVEQEVYAVFLELNGKWRGIGNFLNDSDFGDADFKATRSALLGADFAGHDDAGFLSEAFESFEGIGIFFQGADTLDDAGAIAKDGENQLAGFANVVEPAANGDFLTVEFTGILNRDCGHSGFLQRNSKTIV